MASKWERAFSILHDGLSVRGQLLSEGGAALHGRILVKAQMNAGSLPKSMFACDVANTSQAVTRHRRHSPAW